MWRWTWWVLPVDIMRCDADCETQYGSDKPDTRLEMYVSFGKIVSV